MQMIFFVKPNQALCLSIILLHRLLTQPKNTEHNLRQRTHNLTLPMDINAAMKQNFVYRMLFRDIYQRRFYVLFSLVHFPTDYTVYFSFAIFRCCMCVCHTLLKYYLLTYLITAIQKTDWKASYH